MTPLDYGLSYLPYASLENPFPKGNNVRVKTPTATIYDYNHHDDHDVYLDGKLLCSLYIKCIDDLYQPRIWNNTLLQKVLPSVASREEALEKAVTYIKEKVEHLKKGPGRQNE